MNEDQQALKIVLAAAVERWAQDTRDTELRWALNKFFSEKAPIPRSRALVAYDYNGRGHHV